jgi:hypothetical protein
MTREEIMKLVITQGYTDLAHLRPLFQALHQRWPQGFIQYRPATNRPEVPLLVVDIQPYPGITKEDRAFMDDLERKQHLFSCWFHDPISEI